MKIKMMLLLGLFCGLQGSQNKDCFGRLDVDKALSLVISDSQLKPEFKKNSMVVCCFKPTDTIKARNKNYQSIKNAIANSPKVFQESFRKLLLPIEMITQKETPIVNVFNAQQNEWSELTNAVSLIAKKEAVVVYNVFGDDKPDFDFLKQLKDTKVSVVVNVEHSSEMIENIKNTCGDVIIFASDVEEDSFLSSKSIKKALEFIGVTKDSTQNSEVQEQSKNQQKKNFFVGYKKYIFGSLTFAGLVALYLYNKDFFVTQFFVR